MEWIIAIGGLAVAAVGIVLIWARRDVSVGHAAVIAAGVALSALPQVSNFEWSDNGFRFAAKTTALNLADQMATIAGSQKTDAEALSQLTTQIELLARQVDELRTQISSTTGQPNAIPKFDLGALETLKNKAQKSVAIHADNINRIEEFRGFVESGEFGKLKGEWVPALQTPGME